MLFCCHLTTWLAIQDYCKQETWHLMSQRIGHLSTITNLNSPMKYIHYIKQYSCSLFVWLQLFMRFSIQFPTKQVTWCQRDQTLWLFLSLITSAIYSKWLDARAWHGHENNGYEYDNNKNMRRGANLIWCKRS